MLFRSEVPTFGSGVDTVSDFVSGSGVIVDAVSDTEPVPVVSCGVVSVSVTGSVVTDGSTGALGTVGVFTGLFLPPPPPTDVTVPELRSNEQNVGSEFAV